MGSWILNALGIDNPEPHAQNECNEFLYKSILFSQDHVTESAKTYAYGPDYIYYALSLTSAPSYVSHHLSYVLYLLTQIV